MTQDEIIEEAREDALEQLLDCYQAHGDDMCPKLRLLAKTILENINEAASNES